MFKEQSRFKIYGLLDPREFPPIVRYVGATSGSVDNRLSIHITQAVNKQDTRPVSEWIRELLMEDVEPTYMTFERVSVDQWEEREKYWISRHSGPDLLNVAHGGKGSPGVVRSEELRKRVGDFFRGRSLPQEHRDKISQAKMGHAMPDHVREALLKANQGNKQSAATIEKRKQSRLANPHMHTEEAKASISSTRKRMIAEGQIVMPKGGMRAAAEKLSGSIWINDGTSNRRVKPDEIPPGWKPGRV